jgi:hypothetical protein
MARRLSSAVVLLSFLVAGTPCAGWALGADARRECCMRDHCPDQMDGERHAAPVSQAAANRCCATGEQRQQDSRSQSPVRIAASVAVPVIDAVPAFVAPEMAPPADKPVAPAPRSAPLHVLLSVFLI